jgi:prevent-host-death family protein
MIRVSISSLKARLSRYLASVRGGQEVLVTDRGTPIARLVPLRGPAEEERRRSELVASGRLRPPRDPLPADFWERPRPADPEGRGLFSLLEERAEGP